MADGVWKGVSPLVIGRSEQLWLNRFCDPSYIFCVLQRPDFRPEVTGFVLGFVPVPILENFGLPSFVLVPGNLLSFVP